MHSKTLDREGLLAKLAEWKVEQETLQHALSPTCEIHSANLKGTPFEKYIGKGQAKNLFFKVPSGGGALKNKLFLVCALVETAVDNKSLSTRLGIKASAPLRLAADDVFDKVLQIPKGSVNPFVMAQETCSEVSLLLDDNFLRCEKLLFHPMQSDYTTALSPDALQTFLEAAAPGRYAFVDLGGADPIAAPGGTGPGSTPPEAPKKQEKEKEKKAPKAMAAPPESKGAEEAPATTTAAPTIAAKAAATVAATTNRTAGWYVPPWSETGATTYKQHKAHLESYGL